jgi:hypothetical protein
MTAQRAVPVATHPTTDDSDDLLCPACGGANLHHNAVIVFNRVDGREDAPSFAIRVDGENITCTDSNVGNPSSRRNAVAIEFWCETCPEISELVLTQHKGTSPLGWQRTGHYRININKKGSNS